MGIPTNELQQVTSILGTDSLLADTAAAGTGRITMAQAAQFFGAELVKADNPVGAALSNKVPLWDGAGAHNALCCEKYLGDHVTPEQYAAIADGSFRGLYPGYFWTIGGVNYRIGGLDYFLNTGDIKCVKHHIVVVPDTSISSAIIYGIDTTARGYGGSEFRTSEPNGLAKIKTIIKTAFPKHVLRHRVSLINATTDGRPSAFAWYDSEAELMTEQMVYGGGIITQMSNGSDLIISNRVEKSQLPLFMFRPDLIANGYAYWLQDVASNTQFGVVSGAGLASCNTPWHGHGIRLSAPTRKCRFSPERNVIIRRSAFGEYATLITRYLPA